MKRCLNDGALLRLFMKEATAAEQSHLRLCAACAERFDALTEDLHAIEAILAKPPPPMVVTARRRRAHIGWVPAAACVALLATLASVIALLQPAPPAVTAGSTRVSALAADVSAALFAYPEAGTFPAIESEPLAAAFQAGRACTQEAYFNGECDDQLSVLLLEASD